jgi:hypothetical protein
VEIPFEALRHHPRCAGLGQPRNPLRQQVAVRQQGHQHAVDKGYLTEDALVDVVFEGLELLVWGHVNSDSGVVPDCA